MTEPALRQKPHQRGTPEKCEQHSAADIGYGDVTNQAVLRRTLEPEQYTIAFTERLAQAGVSPSIGTVGDAFDDALAETVIGLYKTELINPNRPWKNVDQVEIATLRYVDWFNNNRLYEENGDIPPVELEQAYYRQHRSSA